MNEYSLYKLVILQYQKIAYSAIKTTLFLSISSSKVKKNPTSNHKIIK